MKAPPDARLVAIRIPGKHGQRVAVVIGNKVHLFVRMENGGTAAWNPKGRRIEDVEIVRDATKREGWIGMVL